MTTNRVLALIIAALVVFGFASPSTAKDNDKNNPPQVVTLQCDILHKVFSVGTSAGVVLPAGVTPGNSCPEAISELLGAGFEQRAAFNVTASGGNFAGPYYEFVKGGKDS